MVEIVVIAHPPDRRIELFFSVVIRIAHPPDRRLELFFPVSFYVQIKGGMICITCPILHDIGCIDLICNRYIEVELTDLY